MHTQHTAGAQAHLTLQSHIQHGRGDVRAHPHMALQAATKTTQADRAACVSASVTACPLRCAHEADQLSRRIGRGGWIEFTSRVPQDN